MAGWSLLVCIRGALFHKIPLLSILFEMAHFICIQWVLEDEGRLCCVCSETLHHGGIYYQAECGHYLCRKCVADHRVASCDRCTAPFTSAAPVMVLLPIPVQDDADSADGANAANAQFIRIQRFVEGEGTPQCCICWDDLENGGIYYQPDCEHSFLCRECVMDHRVTSCARCTVPFICAVPIMVLIPVPK